MGNRPSSAQGDSEDAAVCPGCGLVGRKAARYCARCGSPLGKGPSRRHTETGRDVQPLAPPPGMIPCGRAADLYYRLESAWGGKVLGSETLAIVLFNGGHALSSAVLEIKGIGGADGRAFTAPQGVGLVPRGESIRVEVPSYDLPDDPRDLSVSLSSADMDDESD